MDANAHTAAPREQQALAIFERHVAAFTSGNLDAVLNDFGEHAVVITPDGVFEGPEQIRALYGGLLAEFGTIDRGDSPGLTLDALHVRHDMIFITWHAESMHKVFPFGTDTFLCQGDRFERQTIAFSTPHPRQGTVG
jgi:ketosteroid isomerase-like protein